MSGVVEFFTSLGLPVHLTVATAGLYAQVLPVLVIALLLEGKSKVEDFGWRWLAVLNEVIRILAITGGATSALICLYLVGVNREGHYGHDLGATAALYLVGASFCLFITKVLAGSVNDLLTELSSPSPRS